MSVASQTASPVLPTDIVDAEIFALQKHKERLLEVQRLREEVMQLSRETLPSCGDAAVMEIIKQEVSIAFSVSIADINSKKRPESLTVPRHIAFFIAHQLTRASLYDIGKWMGGKDRGTVLHGCNRIQGWIDIGRPTAIKVQVESIMQSCKRRLDAAAEWQKQLLGSGLF
jgi:chromosomal replication initiation ATPase DnaA